MCCIARLTDPKHDALRIFDMTKTPVILWLRRDLRLDDHPALAAACASARPVIPVFIRDAGFDRLGAATKWRFGLALEAFGRRLSDLGSQLILRSGPAAAVLDQVIQETGARQVFWSRSYDPAGLPEDIALKAGLKSAGIGAESFDGFLLVEPWRLQTKAGTGFRVFTPFWRALASQDIRRPLAPPTSLAAPEAFPRSEALEDWNLARGMDRGALVVRPNVHVGETEAQLSLERFATERMAGYASGRDHPALLATSGLSENLTYGEISATRIWHRLRLAADLQSASAEPFLRQLAWRDFAWHLYWHAPDLPSKSWNPKWADFAWRQDPEALADWQRGQTGIDLVDAGMRELHVTGRMHNRVRMVVASYLTKHLLIDWREGARFFAEHLVDFDPAANAMGWQWVAGSGPDAAPYFRVFNPERQADKFDPKRAYIDRFLGDTPEAHSFYDAIPKSWKITAASPSKPARLLSEGRERALRAYSAAFPKSPQRAAPNGGLDP